MKAVATVIALALLAGVAMAQDVASRKSGDEELKAAILKRVEERLKQNAESILTEVRRMLDAHFAKAAAPAAKQPGFLGIQGKELADGIEVVQVIKETPAARAGLKTGDVVLSVNGRKVNKIQDLLSLLREVGAGQQAKVEYRREGKVATATAALMARPQDDDGDDEDGDDDDEDGDDDDDAPGKPGSYFGRLGLETKETANGIQIVGVKKDSIGSKMGLQKDDVFTAINGKKVASVNDFMKNLIAAGPGGTAKIEYKRGDKAHEITVQVRRGGQDDDGDDDDGDDDDR